MWLLPVGYIVSRVNSNCEYCQIGLKNLAIVSKVYTACDHCQLGVFPQNVDIFSTVYIKCGH